jgi:DNA topoisomerase-1
MGKKLVVVESPAKAKTINKILGREYVVKSSVGHVRDLPEKSLGVDIKEGFKPRYVLSKGKKAVVAELKKAARECDAVFLAPDPDREGEAIAWHLKEVLASAAGDSPFFRVRYNEITPRAVTEAFAHPGEIDMNRVNAQQARRILDRIVGYTVSPMLWRRVKRGLSAGRVQSVALRLVCEREAEIRRFVPEAYWMVGATVRKLVAPQDPFGIKLAKIDGNKPEIKSAEQDQAVRGDLEGRALRVANIARREVRRSAPPPFITSSLQQAASNKYQYSPKRTMGIAQKLYEGVDLGQGSVGLITYMRTDSFSVSREAVGACRAFIETQIGPEYYPETPNVFKSRSSAQEAHEAIRPTDVNLTPEQVKGRLEASDWKLYLLIWERFVASQMSQALIEQTSVDVDAVPKAEGDKTYLFRVASSKVKFAGYMKISGTDIGKKDEEGGDVERLPDLIVGEPLECLEWLSERKETTPPPRYSEASLVRELERNGVGRPSTYAQIITTLDQRKYVGRHNRSLTATDLGMQVSELLSKTLNDLFDVKFTASMEELLDEVEQGKVEWTGMLTEFYARFAVWMEGAKAPAANTESVAAVLAALEHVREWAPEVKRGKRTYSDEKFVQSIRGDLANAGKSISQRQLDALIRIACRYRGQNEQIVQAVEAAGFGELLQDPDLQPPTPSTLKKLELLAGITMDDGATNFVSSLSARVQGNRRLTQPQLRALNNIVLSHAKQFVDFESQRKDLEIENSEVEQDDESAPLLEGMGKVQEWKPPVARGKRVFNDKAFYESLKSHFESKGFLSERQRKALRRMVERYSAGIAGYGELAEKLNLKPAREKP